MRVCDPLTALGVERTARARSRRCRRHRRRRSRRSRCSGGGARPSRSRTRTTHGTREAGPPLGPAHAHTHAHTHTHTNHHEHTSHCCHTQKNVGTNVSKVMHNKMMSKFEEEEVKIKNCTFCEIFVSRFLTFTMRDFCVCVHFFAVMVKQIFVCVFLTTNKRFVCLLDTLEYSFVEYFRGSGFL